LKIKEEMGGGKPRLPASWQWNARVKKMKSLYGMQIEEGRDWLMKERSKSVAGMRKQLKMLAGSPVVEAKQEGNIKKLLRDCASMGPSMRSIGNGKGKFA